MNVARIAELLEPFFGPGPVRLTDAQLAHISTYIDLLRRWNARVNLTAIRGPEKIVTRHFGESLFAARHLFPPHDHTPVAEPAESIRVTLADIGSGAGFPGVPIKLWTPDISLTLIESNQKKAVFLRELCRALSLTGLNVNNARAETLAGQTFDIVTLRAVERFTDVLGVAASLVRPSGRLALLVSSAQVKTAESMFPQFRWDIPTPIPMSESRRLLIGEKDAIR
ncbi:MAG TPA: 16S rRNA (guanine(527)-N(7))-methyltransferase RsmG [Candidatus Aquilonibacter sp.]|nr:16S rRNA (guanine(527)-N(7))-methyltransferase RsmG [Candidatus Aquilonibacter sp.]